jgi:hypothetical protein
VLLELQSRAEDIQKHLPRVLEMLCSDSIMDRQFGYAALLSVFPETARELARISHNWGRKGPFPLA